MNKLLLSAALLAPAFLSAADSKPATFVSHDKVNATLAKGGPLVNAPDALVSISHRDKPGQVEVHAKQTDVMYILEGTATLVTGGTMTGGKVSAPDQMLGTGIDGGETHHLTKGDVIVVPAGTPHWFKEVPGPITYYVVKALH
jgi:mannose-6-phosphate isomerase-like protein (cupin superfamily)